MSNHLPASHHHLSLWFALKSLLVCQLVLGATGIVWAQPGGNRRATTLADLSGMTWVGGDYFVAVHDAKAVDERSLPRVATLQIPRGPKGVLYRDSRIVIKGQVPNDLESVAGIPGRQEFLLVESGDGSGDTLVPKIYKAKLRPGGVRVTKVKPWPVAINNVEGTAVAKVGDDYFFLFAERADNQESTQLCWVLFDPQKLKFLGEVQSVTFAQPDPARFNRVIVGLDVDSQGLIYSVSAFDPENADPPITDNPDNGPFAAGVYVIGAIHGESGHAEIELLPTPSLLGMVDGCKVESVAIKEDTNAGTFEIFIGTDDENYGGVIRPLPPPVINR